MITQTRFLSQVEFYSYLKLSIGFNFAALIAGITPEANPTTTATDTETTTGQILNGTLYSKINRPTPWDKPTPKINPNIDPMKDIKIDSDKN